MSKLVLRALVAFWLIAAAAVAQASLDLARQKNCLACHAVNKPQVGPSFQVIAQRYRANPAAAVQPLSDTIVRGGVGVYGTLPMPANTGLSAADALALSKWILGLSTPMLVRLHMAQGPVDLALDFADTPATVQNFLGYVERGDYNGTFFHRLVRGFVLQGGGFRFDDNMLPRAVAVPQQSPVNNEFIASRSNVRGTVAMAKLGGNPNSATNQWFVNLADNGANLDNQNGGFTVFGRVTAPSMAIVDRLAALSWVDASVCTTVLGASASAFSNLPLVKPLAANTCTSILRENLASVTRAQLLPARLDSSDADRILDYLEAAYPQYATPAGAATLSWEGYTYRYYTTTNAYAGVKDGVVYYLVPSLGGAITAMGTVASWLAIAQAAGY